MSKIIDMVAWRSRVRDELTAEIMHHDNHKEDDIETDRIYASLNRLYAETPISDAEKVVVAWTRLVQQIADIDDKSERQRYVKRITQLLNQDIVEAARTAFDKMK